MVRMELPWSRNRIPAAVGGALVPLLANAAEVFWTWAHPCNESYLTVLYCI